MGLHVYILRSSHHGKHDCTNGGISANTDCLTLVNVDGPFQPNIDAPAAMLVSHNVFGDHNPMARIVPAVDDGNGGWKVDPRWAMFGGNYAATSDSRFWEAVRRLNDGRYANGAIPIHDRYEG